MAKPPHIVIVGGGAGGLELATALGDGPGRRGEARVTLVDLSLTHLWKPLLYEVAAGTLDACRGDVEYLAQAARHHFRFRLGRMSGLDRAARRVSLDAVTDAAGAELAPAQELSYDVLVLCVGGRSNDFGTPGAREHCVSLDSEGEAGQFHRRLLAAYLHAQARSLSGSGSKPGSGSESGSGSGSGAVTVRVVVIGGGATGVELAAELRAAAYRFHAYGFERVHPESGVKITLLQSPPRLLNDMRPDVSAAVERRLRAMGVEVLTAERAVEVTAEGVHTRSGRFLPAPLKVWAAGVRGHDFAAGLGLEVNRLGQIVVRPTLQTTLDDHVFAFGDCASAPLPGGEGRVPPRAQAAHQQARLLRRSIPRLLAGRPLPNYVYRDYGSLITLGRDNTLGQLMGRLTGSITVSGRLARLMYWSLEKDHERALHGTLRTAMTALAHALSRESRPALKLH